MNERKTMRNKWKRVSHQVLISERMLLFLLIVLLICPWMWTEKWTTELQWVQLLFLPYQFSTYQTGLLFLVKVRLYFGEVRFKVSVILVGNLVWKADFSENNF